MELIVTPVTVDLIYQVFFEEPAFELIKDESRVSLIEKMLKSFELRLNDLKFNGEALSDNFIHFSKLYAPGFLNVSFGLEEVSASLRNPRDEAQVADAYGRLFKLFEQNPISRQIMTIQRQLSTEGDSISFLNSLNPHYPSNFERFLERRGVYYTLKIPENELTIYVTVVSSLFVENGVFLSIENHFSPNRYDFKNAFKIAKERHDFILKELNISIKLEA